MAISRRSSFMQVELFKKNGSYTNEQGEVINTTNLYVKCGDTLIPIDVHYFPDKDTKRDDQYKSRKSIMNAFATTLPEKTK
jgi:hypothetical protein